MTVYFENNKEKDSIEVVINCFELKELVSALTEFESRIEQYKNINQENANLGFTHIHLKDCGPLCKKSKTDIVFYVNLNEL